MISCTRQRSIKTITIHYFDRNRGGPPGTKWLQYSHLMKQLFEQYGSRLIYPSNGMLMRSMHKMYTG